MKLTDLIIPGAIVGVLIYAVSKFKNPFGDWGSWNNPFGGGANPFDPTPIVTEEDKAAVDDTGGTVTTTGTMPFWLNIFPGSGFFDYGAKDRTETLYTGKDRIATIDKTQDTTLGKIMSFTPKRSYTQTNVKYVDRPKSKLRVAADAWATVNPALYPGYKVGTMAYDAIKGNNQKKRIVTKQKRTVEAFGSGAKILGDMQKRIKAVQKVRQRNLDILKRRGQ